jgi:hypothetical protein
MPWIWAVGKTPDAHTHTVSPHLHVKMKKNWGVVQLVGHLTVNEDGEGSNPSAPAKFPVLFIINRIVAVPVHSRRRWRQS